MEPSLLIYVPALTPRISYTFSLFFDSLVNTPFRLTTNTEEYKACSSPKFSYANEPLETGGLFFASCGLLLEKDIRPQTITIREWQGLKIFYPVHNGALPFDVFAASFYLVSRYEEYLARVKDMHKRFRAQDSLAFKNHFTGKPLVNLWAAELKKLLIKNFPQLKITENKYRFIPTIDIDVAYAHLGRNWKITAGSLLLALLKLRLLFAADKTLTLLRLKKDRYDTYAYQEALFKKYNLRPIYFFLAAKRGKYDKNISTRSRTFARLVKRVAKYADIGIHPSYQSQSRPETVETEIKRVEKSLHNQITKSRQHFLRVLLPETYRCLAQLNITDDYSLAHASCAGFRAGICTPFFFYDLPAEAVLPVRVHSSIVMDGTLLEYMHLSPVQAIAITEKLIAEVKQCNGEFISIWHNHSLKNQGVWKGWSSVFETLVEKAM